MELELHEKNLGNETIFLTVNRDHGSGKQAENLVYLKNQMKILDVPFRCGNIIYFLNRESLRTKFIIFLNLRLYL